MSLFSGPFPRQPGCVNLAFGCKIFTLRLVTSYSSPGFCGRKGLDLPLTRLPAPGKSLVSVSNCGTLGPSLVASALVTHDDSPGRASLIKCTENWLEVFVRGLNVFYFAAGALVAWGVRVG